MDRSQGNGIRADDDKLLPSEADYEIATACSGLEDLCRLAEDGVSDLVPMRIVDALEVLNVHHQHVRMPRPMGVEIHLQCLCEPSAVEQLSQGITHREPSDERCAAGAIDL